MTFEAIFMKITYSTTTKLRLLSQFQNVNESLKVFADYHNVGVRAFKALDPAVSNWRIG